MRTRTTPSGGFTDVVTHTIRHVTGQSDIIDATYTQRVGELKVKTIEDVGTSGYKLYKKCGVLPLNPVNISTITEKRLLGDGVRYGGARDNTSPGSVRYTWEPVWGGLTDFGLLPIPPVNQALLTAAVNKAVANARAPNWDVLTFLGELKETREMFQTAAHRVRHFGDKAISRVKSWSRGPKHALKDLSGYWMEYRYGWRPAMSDLQNAISALTAKRDVNYLLGRATFVDPFEDIRDSGLVPADTIADYQVIRSVSGSHTVHGFARSRVAAQRIRFGLDPIVAGWELTRLSFVLDWFVDIGSWLQAISPMASGSDFDSCVSIHTTATQQVVGWVHGKDPGGPSFSEGSQDRGDWSIRTESYQRIPMGVSLPSWNPRIDITKGVDLAIIATQLRNVLGGKIARGLRI